MLKPQDTLIALKLWADYQQQLVMPLREAASLVGISVSEFSKGLRRCCAVRYTKRVGNRKELADQAN
jgi:hypothetical protein